MLSCRLKIAFIRLFSHRRCGCEREARKKWLCKKEQFLEQHSNHLKPILDFIQPWLHCHAGWGRPLVTLLSKASFWGPFLCYFPWTREDPQVSCWNVLHISDSILAQQMLSTQVLSSLTLFMPFSHSFPIFFPDVVIFSPKKPPSFHWRRVSLPSWGWPHPPGRWCLTFAAFPHHQGPRLKTWRASAA